MPEASARPETGLGRCGAWHLLGRLVRAPAQLVREEHETYERILRDPPSWVDAEEQAETRRFFRQQLRKRAVSLVRSLHAASRTAEAAEEACRCDPSADMAEALAAARESGPPRQRKHRRCALPCPLPCTRLHSPGV